MLPNLSNLTLADGAQEPVGAPVDPDGNKKLNRLGPQSTRPLPRWCWWSKKQSRWRRFDNAKTDASRNRMLELLSEHSKDKKGLEGGVHIKWSKGGGITIVKWDHTNRRGTFAWVEGGEEFVMERLTQKHAAEVQANNFVYDHSGIENPSDDMLAANAHVVPHFRDMLERELENAKTHAFLYHSYHNVALIYDLGACLTRVAFPENVKASNRHSLVLRTDRSTFNTRSPRRVKENFQKWYGGTDVAMKNPPTRKYPWIGVSMVLNCFKSNPESTVVEDFRTGYNPGDSPDLNPILDELLSSFGITKLKEELLQLTIEADVDVTSYFGKYAHFFWRSSAKERWTRMSSPLDETLLFVLSDFMEHDNQLGPKTAELHDLGWTVELRRARPGMQARGTAKSYMTGVSREVLTVTVNAGHYLQLGIPLTKVERLAYAAQPFGVPDTTPAHALAKVDEREDVTTGQARLIARPDLMWGEDVLQKVYQFSRGAEAARTHYLERMEALLRKEFEARGPSGLEGVKNKLRPPPIVVRSHNVLHKNPKTDKLVGALSKGAYDFACLQECTTKMLNTLASALPTSHAVLYDHACGLHSTPYAVMVYRKARFTMRMKSGAPHYTCFKLKDGTKANGRPVVGAVFHDEWLGRRLLVLSVHAPHNSKQPYALMPNLQLFVHETIEASDGAWNPGVGHVVIAGDFNRDDWAKDRRMLKPYELKLRSAQGALHKPLATGWNKAIDNILFGSREFRHVLELDAFYVEEDKHGSDHSAVVAKFLC